MLDGGNARVSEQLLGPVVDELAVDKAVDAVGLDLVHLGLHLVALGALELGELTGGIDTDASTKNLDLVGIHGYTIAK